jgi:hypothetical protein
MNFVTIHRVFGLVHANPVRDFQGHVKTTIQNGTERQCIPSQAVKAHWRDAIAASPALAEIFAKTGTTVRSALIGKELIGKALVKAGLTEAEANAWGETTMRLFKKAAKDDKATDDKPAAKPAKGKKAPAQAETPDGSEDDVSEVLAEPEKDKRHILVLGSREIEALTVLALTAHKAGVAHKDLYKLVDKKSKRSGQPQAMLNALDTLDGLLPAGHHPPPPAPGELPGARRGRAARAGGGSGREPDAAVARSDEVDHPRLRDAGLRSGPGRPSAAGVAGRGVRRAGRGQPLGRCRSAAAVRKGDLGVRAERHGDRHP